MLNSGKKSRFARQKNKYSNSRDVRKKNSERKKNLYPATCKLYGRSLIYTKEELQAFQIDTKIYEFVEYVQIGVHNGTEDKLILTCIYRSPSASSTSCIKELEEILQTNKIDSVKYSYLLYVCRRFQFQRNRLGK